MGSNLTEFGKLCRNCRINKGLNMTRAAELTGKSQATLTNYETGKESPSFEFIETSMEVYGITKGNVNDNELEGWNELLAWIDAFTERLKNLKPDFNLSGSNDTIKRAYL
jgi:transcriptional regulator with XRE-family HTH domain